jgi:hypothetical protein
MAPLQIIILKYLIMSNDIHTYTVSKLRFSFGEKKKLNFHDYMPQIQVL